MAKPIHHKHLRSGATSPRSYGRALLLLAVRLNTVEQVPCLETHIHGSLFATMDQRVRLPSFCNIMFTNVVNQVTTSASSIPMLAQISATHPLAFEPLMATLESQPLGRSPRRHLLVAIRGSLPLVQTPSGVVCRMRLVVCRQTHQHNSSHIVLLDYSHLWMSNKTLRARHILLATASLRI